MSSATPPLTEHHTFGEWLAHPEGGPLIRELLGNPDDGQGERSDGGVDGLVGPMRDLPMRQLRVLSRGGLTQEVLDSYVRRANGGVLPTDPGPEPRWREQITPRRFTGQTVLVTGAASGIGRAVASRVLREGGRVVAADLDGSGLDDLVADHPNTEVVTVVGDVAVRADVEAVVAAAGPRIDGLANVAGINDDFSPAHLTPDEVWERVLAVDLTGPFQLVRAVVPTMLEAGRGAIVTVASEAGLRGNASGTAYTVAKHGVVGLTRSAAFMYGPRGVRVNAVAPGGTATGIPMGFGASEEGLARLNPFHALLPALAVAEHIAASVTFLLSDDAVNVNGAILPSDNGWSVQ